MSDTTQDEPSDPLVGTTVAGRYEVETLLGAGGMGAVYRARHVQLKKPVALKVLHGQMTMIPEVVARFEREAVAAARIDHPNVASATDFGTLGDDSFFLVLEYVDGRSLSKEIEAGPLALDRALAIARQIADALVAAHAAGIVHRDLKPDNVMLIERHGDPDVVKVLDFGIAKLTDPETAGDKQLTQIGSVFGTPEYMAPEQAAGQPVDARADVYALGIILFEMLTGQPPFSADTIPETLSQQLTRPPPPLSPETPPAVASLVEYLLAKDRDLRPQTAQIVRDRLAELGSVASGYDPTHPDRSPVRAPAPASPVFAHGGSGAAGAPGSAAAPGSTAAPGPPASDAEAYSQTMVAGEEHGEPAPPSALPPSVAAMSAPAASIEALKHPTDQRRRLHLTLAAALVAAGMLVTVGLVAWGGTSEPNEQEPIAGPASVASTAAAAAWKRATRDALTRTAEQPDGTTSDHAAATGTGAAPSSGAPHGSTTGSSSTSSTTTTTTSKDGTKTTTTVRKSKRSSRTTTSTTKKRRTGPGGIYIPPPSEWFKKR